MYFNLQLYELARAAWEASLKVKEDAPKVREKLEKVLELLDENANTSEQTP